MILNNGREEVDTSQATFLGKSETVYKEDSYSHDTRWVFTAWKSNRTDKAFITGYYEESITGWIDRLIYGKPRTGHILVCVYFDDHAFKLACAQRGIMTLAGGQRTLEQV